MLLTLKQPRHPAYEYIMINDVIGRFGMWWIELKNESGRGNAVKREYKSES